MFDHNNPGQPGGAEPPTSTTEQLLRLFSQRPVAPNDDDAVNNPELEQLFGSLAKGLEQGTVDSALAPKGEPLTLEALAASLGQPVALGEVPAALAAREEGVACSKCGWANLAATSFCGMCGHGLVTETPSASGNWAKPVLDLLEPPNLAQIGGRIGSSMGFKMALAGVLVLVLGVVVYQQRGWRLPRLTGVTSNVSAVRTSSLPPQSRTAQPPAEAAPAPAPPPKSVNREPATVATAPATEAAPAPAQPPKSVNREPAAIVRAPANVIRRPATATKPPKAAPPTVIARSLPEPRPPLPAAPAPPRIALPVLPPATAAEPVKPPPVQKAPAAAPEVSAPAPKPAQIPQLTPGVLISRVNPQYPPVARAARVQGAVVMHAVIGTDGTIQQLRVISGNPLLVNAAMEAAKQWRYRPYLLDGKPVEGETDISINFKGE